ncbi:hypothetical protein K443DRAFT_7613 [Laccaria amethystina LaAM-08-1]|uniref:Unplaced genomic scaffold K443scaffold_89, whole genome shotgun sequence n=1 Tax=Laccaria amethystina LaAM-08-1 TaxID=1095629 RepID=A0A0C9XX93_9AGAR|nr:hypothetical protein K443DRAFT_7613 [Laccaria amethystina LaAM-08-1]
MGIGPIWVALSVVGQQQIGTFMASIIPVELIQQSVHLIPDFGAIAPAHWKSSNVLEEVSHFYVSSFSDHFQYSTLY